MTQIEPATQRMRRRRRSRRSRAKRWVRVLWPILPLAGAVLLSVGVIRVVERGPNARSGADMPNPQTLDALDHLDVDLYDEGIYWDRTRLRRAAEQQRKVISLDSQGVNAEGVVSEILPQTFLEDPLDRAEDAPVPPETATPTEQAPASSGGPQA